MKFYKYNDEVYTKLPDPFMNTSPMTDEVFIVLGGRIEDVVTPEEQEFYTACSQFRAVCAAIGQFLDDPDFRGGFDEYIHFATSEQYQANPVLGNSLAIQWSGTNEFCKYTGSKIGLGQPDWWYQCWSLVQTDEPEESESEEDEPEELEPEEEQE